MAFISDQQRKWYFATNGGAVNSSAPGEGPPLESIDMGVGMVKMTDQQISDANRSRNDDRINRNGIVD